MHVRAGCAAAATGRRSCRPARSARGSASIRRTCCSSTAGVAAACPGSATVSSSSSGMLLQRKNDSRDASSRSLIAIRACPARTPAGSRSTRNTNFGLARMRCSAELDAGVEAAAARGPARRTPSAARVSALGTGRRYARRASVADDLPRARALRCARRRPDGTRRCAGGSACRRAPVGVERPGDRHASRRAARPSQSKVSNELRRNGCSRCVSCDAAASATNAAVTVARARP